MVSARSAFRLRGLRGHAKTKPMLAPQIMRRSDGRYLAKKAQSGYDPLGVGGNLNQAIETAVREATEISHDKQYRVALGVELANGNFRRDQIVNPPLRNRRKPQPYHVATCVSVVCRTDGRAGHRSTER
jgi:hypothetical protein